MKLTLDPNAPKFDKFGDVVAGGNQAPLLAFDCTLKLVKREKDRTLWEVTGPKIVSRLSLTTFPFDTSPDGDARLLVQDRTGEVRYVVSFMERRHRVPPCHPGCFPAGTLIHVPGGTKAIEGIRMGDLVTTIDADGKLSSAKVTDVFTTRNRVLEVRVDGSKLVTTDTQPVALEAGDFRPARELKAGDRIWQWTDGKRRAVAVREVSPTDRQVEVFNLVLGEPTGFIAGGFVVRSKPPAVPAPIVRP
jgi:hypothetical protein